MLGAGKGEECALVWAWGLAGSSGGWLWGGPLLRDLEGGCSLLRRLKGEVSVIEGSGGWRVPVIEGSRGRGVPIIEGSGLLL